jgi:S1-C subfamily serine protease
VPVVAALLGGALTAAAMIAGAGPGVPGRQEGLAVLGSGDRLTAHEIYERAAPGTVYIRARSLQASASAFAGGSGGELSIATGSGFVLDDDGRVLTSAHVVSGVTDVQVTFPNGRTVPARVVGKDEETDVALLAVDPQGLDLRPLELGDSDAVRPGEQAMAIGNPTGLQATAGTGRIAAADRRIQAPGGYVIDGVFETDAVIEPATSGGPLMGPDGRVIGLTSRLAAEDGGASFAVPVNTVREVLAQLEDGHHKVIRSYMGVTGQTVERGVHVIEVHPAGPAARAGLHAGDTIEAIDGQPVRTWEGMLAAVERRRPGDTVELQVLRDGSRGDVEVRLDERPATLSAG